MRLFPIWRVLACFLLAACLLACLLAKPVRSTLDTKEGYKTKTGSTSSVTMTLTLTMAQPDMFLSLDNTFATGTAVARDEHRCQAQYQAPLDPYPHVDHGVMPLQESRRATSIPSYTESRHHP